MKENERGMKKTDNGTKLLEKVRVREKEKWEPKFRGNERDGFCLEKRGNTQNIIKNVCVCVRERERERENIE